MNFIYNIWQRKLISISLFGTVINARGVINVGGENPQSKINFGWVGEGKPK